MINNGQLPFLVFASLLNLFFLGLNNKQGLNVPAKCAHTTDLGFMFSANSLPHFIFGILFVLFSS